MYQYTINLRNIEDLTTYIILDALIVGVTACKEETKQENLNNGKGQKKKLINILLLI